MTGQVDNTMFRTVGGGWWYGAASVKHQKLKLLSSMSYYVRGVIEKEPHLVLEKLYQLLPALKQPGLDQEKRAEIIALLECFIEEYPIIIDPKMFNEKGDQVGISEAFKQTMYQLLEEARESSNPISGSNFDNLYSALTTLRNMQMGPVATAKDALQTKLTPLIKNFITSLFAGPSLQFEALYQTVAKLHKKEVLDKAEKEELCTHLDSYLESLNKTQEVSSGKEETCSTSERPVNPLQTFDLRRNATLQGSDLKELHAALSAARNQQMGALGLAQDAFSEKALPQAEVMTKSLIGRVVPATKKAIRKAICRTPCRQLEELYQTLVDLQNKSSLQKEERLKAAEQIEQFLQKREQILADTFDADGNQIKLSNNQENEIISLLLYLEKDSSHTHSRTGKEKDTSDDEEPIPPELIKGPLKTLSYFRDLQMGARASIRQCFEKAASPGTDLSENKRHLKQKRLESLRNTAPEKQDVELPDNVKEARKEQFSKLKELALRGALTRLVFWGDNDFFARFSDVLKLTEEQTRKENRVEHSANTYFREALSMTMNENKSRSWISSLSRSTLDHLAPVLGFYLHSILNNVQADLETFLAKTPEERMELIFALFIKPLRPHFDTFHAALKDAKDKKRSPTEAVKECFSQMKLNQKEIASLFVERYIPRSSRIESLNHQLDRFPGLLKMVLEHPFRLIATVIDWFINMTLRFMLKHMIAKAVPPTLFASTSSALGEHSSYRHAINQFVQEKLRHANSQKTKKLTLLKTPPSLQEDLTLLIRQFCDAIPMEQAMKGGLSTLEAFLDPQHEYLKPILRELEQIGAIHISPIVSAEVLKALETLLQEKELEELAWRGLDNLIKTVESAKEESSSPITHQQKVNMEHLMHAELEEAASRAVEELSGKILDPSQTYNNEIVVRIEGIKISSEELVGKCSTQNSDTVASLTETWADLSHKVSSLMRYLEEIPSPSLQPLEIAVGSFNEAALQFNAAIKGPQQLQKAQLSLEGIKIFLTSKLNILSQPNLSCDQALLTLALLRDTKDKELRKIVNELTPMIENYKALQSPDPISQRIFQSHIETLKTALTHSIQAIDSKIEETSNGIACHTERLQQATEALQDWANNLQPVQVKPEEVSSKMVQLLKAIPGDQLKQKLSEQIMNYGRDALSMIIQPYHLQGMAHNISEQIVQTARTSKV